MASTKVVVTRSLVGMFRFRVTPVAPLTEYHVLVRVERRMASCKFFDRSVGWWTGWSLVPQAGVSGEVIRSTAGHVRNHLIRQ